MLAKYTRRERGFLLISVSAGLILLSIIALMIVDASSYDMALRGRQHDHRLLEYAAEAGMTHGQWLLKQNTSCAGYSDVSATPFGTHSYSASISPASGSPVSLVAQATDSFGNTASLTNAAIAMYQATSTLVLQPGAEGKDSFIEGDPGHQDHNKVDDKDIKTDSESNKQFRGLLEFDLSSLPTGVKIVSASLEIYLDSTLGASDTVSIHSLSSNWVESEVTWLERESGQNWSSAGGDYVASASGSFLTDSVGWKAADLTSLAQQWSDTPTSNNGVILASAATSGNNEKKYVSSDDNVDPSLHPKLTLVYTCECGGTCVSGESSSNNLLMVVVNPASLTKPEDTRKTLVESWGFSVSLIDESDSQSEFDTAAASSDVVYIPETVIGDTVNTKLSKATVGIVYEEYRLDDDFGLANKSDYWTESDIVIVNNSHYITEPFAIGAVTLFSSADDATYLFGNLAPGLQSLGEFQGDPALAVVEVGGALLSGNAAGRRVQLPWGESDLFNFGSLTDDGKIVLKRSLEWGAGSGDEDPDSDSVPVAHWKLDDGGGTNAADSEGDHDGTLVGSPSWSVGPMDGALDLDGSGDRIDASSVLEAGTPQISITAWVLKRDTGDDRVVTKSDGTSIKDHIFSLGVDGTTIRVRLKTTDNDGTSNYDGGSLTLNQWTHVAFTYDGTSLRVYKDGVETAQFAVTGEVVASSLPTVLGNVNTSDNRYWNGELDDVRIYDRALSEPEVVDLVNLPSGGGGGSGKCTGTFADDFESGDYTGNSGSKKWSSDWVEFGDNGSPTGGDEQVLQYDGNWELRVRDNDDGGEGVVREADTSGAKTVSLSLEYWRSSLDGDTDYVAIEVSSKGGSDWSEVGVIEGPAVDDGLFIPETYDISKYASSNMQIRLKTSSTMGGRDEVYFDNIEICVVE